MNDSSQRKSGVVLSYVSIIINTLIQLLYTPFLIRMLGSSEYGLYSLVISIIGYLTVLDLGFGNAIIVYTSKLKAQNKIDEEQKLHGMFLVVFIIIGLIAGLLGVALYFIVPSFFGNSMTSLEIEKLKIMMLILSFNLVITFSFNIYSSIISAYEKFTFQKILSIIGSLLKPLIMLPILFIGYKSIALTIAVTIINVLMCLSNYFYCKNNLKIKIKYKGFDKLLFKTILGYSIYIFLGIIVDKINWNVDQFILGVFSGTVAVSIYSVAGQLNTLFIYISASISSVLLPKVSKMVANNSNNDELSKEFIKVGRIQYLIIFLIASGLIIFGKEFIILWAGPKYESAYYIALLLIIPAGIPLIQNLGISIMQAKNMHKFRSLLYFFIAIANVIISIPLAKLYGGIGAAIGTAISLIIGNIIIINWYYYTKVGINIKKFWKEILKMTFPLLLPAIIILIPLRFLPLKGIMSFIIYVIVYTILYFITAYLFVINNYEKNIINKILIKFHLKKVSNERNN